MICQRTPTFRLLDPIVGWDPAGSIKIDGFDDRRGLRIETPVSGLVCEAQLTPWMPPAWIAFDSSLNALYVCGGRANQDTAPTLISRNACDSQWRNLLPDLDPGQRVCEPVSVAAANKRLALLDHIGKGKYRLWVWAIPSGRLVGRQQLVDHATIALATCVAFAPWREIVVSTDKGLLRFDLSGQYRGLVTEPQLASPYHRMLGSCRKTLWVAREDASSKGYFQIHRVEPTYVKGVGECREQLDFSIRKLGRKPRDWERFTESICKSPISSVAEDRFCIAGSVDSISGRPECYSRTGDRQDHDLGSQCGLPDKTQGTYVTRAIDSTIRNCRWHRVRIDIHLPAQSSFEVEIATSEKANVANLRWAKIENNPTDFLVDQPPGQFLFLKIRLFGNPDSPVIKQVRLDFPRVTSLDQLPGVYREDPEAENFTERFLSLFDSMIEELDRAIEGSSEYLNVDTAPQESLRWLAAFLGIQADSTWTPDQVREILRRAPELYRIRGTKEGLIQALQLVFGSKLRPVVIERSKNRSWGVLGNRASLGGFRLFGKSESRFRVGASALGRAAIRTFGNPDSDPVTQDAHQFEVLVPPLEDANSQTLSRIDKIIDSQKPAHTQHSVRIGGTGFVLGVHSAIGIDTQFVSPPTTVLGEGGFAMRLGEGILGVGPNTPTANMRLDTTAFLGHNTTLE